ncbi:hypothetical protein BDY17DRAFT_301955 [Neohortaea acidophila]|uniref:Uncharacterized protein n=1 Tax=Neohortaea acidophila TaxID=245834 RepID=A0A6A6PM37_9PEZI|nr:uncharacterized protein BDY17DRAFT_301955 [Neohortaea acidophila]KAF2480533.1 hypothetical protein BDY17DRAFT_301955 [Neohortaea acidophila]
MSSTMRARFVAYRLSLIKSNEPKYSPRSSRALSSIERERRVGHVDLDGRRPAPNNP